MNVISMSLYGSDPLYVEGAIANAKLAPKIYPGWEFRVYTEKGHKAIKRLLKAGARVFTMPKSEGSTGMFWRFLASDDPDAERVIFRDADSRLNHKEAAAVAAWQASKKAAHMMRDHEDHANWPFLGGMWGFCGKAQPSMRTLVNQWPSHTNKLDDMKFLAEKIWPVLKDHLLQHTSIESKHGGEPFPTHKPIKGFVGEIVKPKARTRKRATKRSKNKSGNVGNR